MDDKRRFRFVQEEKARNVKARPRFQPVRTSAHLAHGSKSDGLGLKGADVLGHGNRESPQGKACHRKDRASGISKCDPILIDSRKVADATSNVTIVVNSFLLHGRRSWADGYGNDFTGMSDTAAAPSSLVSHTHPVDSQANVHAQS